MQQIRAHEQQMQQQIPLQVAQDKMQGEFLTKIGTRNWTLYLKFSFNLFVQLIQRRIKHKVQSIIIIMWSLTPVESIIPQSIQMLATIQMCRWQIYHQILESLANFQRHIKNHHNSNNNIVWWSECQQEISNFNCQCHVVFQYKYHGNKVANIESCKARFHRNHKHRNRLTINFHYRQRQARMINFHVQHLNVHKILIWM